MLTNLINDLLDLSKIDSLNFKLNEEFFNLIEIVNMSIKTVKYSSDKKNIKFQIEFYNELSQQQKEKNKIFLR
jgi:hypothetical protein